MKKIFHILILIPFLLYPQQEIKIMTYNLLNYPGNDTTGRNPHFRTILENTLPDILIVFQITVRTSQLLDTIPMEVRTTLSETMGL